MNPRPREILCEIVARYGTSVCDDQRRCASLLNDLCEGEWRRERNVLMTALREGVAEQLQTSASNVPTEILLDRLTLRLEEDHGMKSDVARWAVESWALALGKITSPLPPPSPAPSQSTPPQVAKPAPSPKSLPAGTVRINPVDQAEIVWIPEGEFLMGSNDYDNEKPYRCVYLDGFWIYKHPVTVEQYRRFCQEADRTMREPPQWGWQDSHPIVNISWNDAKAYCDWAGASLPTEAQWEKAARGTGGAEQWRDVPKDIQALWLNSGGCGYPWGNKWDGKKCVNSVVPQGLQSTQPVGSYPQGATPYGVLDMAGNVWEWCADWYDPHYYKTAPARNPPGPTSGEHRALRGGSWGDGYPNDFRCSCRIGGGPTNRGIYFGFRCVSVRADSL